MPGSPVERLIVAARMLCARGARLGRAPRIPAGLVAVLLLWTAFAHAADPAHPANCERLALGPGTLEVAVGGDPREPASPVHFVPAAAASMNFGIVRETVWLRFSMAGKPCARPRFLELGNPFVNRVEVYRQAEGGGWIRAWSSDDAQQVGETARLRRAVAPIDPGEGGRFLVGIQGPGAVLVEPRIVSGARLTTGVAGRMLLSGVLGGGIVALAIYCACLAAMLRFQGLLAFSASALALGVYYATSAGMFDQFIVGVEHDPQAARHLALRINGIAVVVAALFHWIFVRALLAAEPGRGRRTTVAVVAASLATLVLIPLLSGERVAVLCMAIGALVAVAILHELMLARRTGHPLVRVTLTAFGSAVVAMFVYIAGYLGLLPWSGGLLDVIAVGVWAETIMLSMAIGLHVKALRGRQQQLEARTAELSLLSRLDQLTGLGNRRAYEAVVPAQIAECRRRDCAAVMMVVDIDHFKRVNDTWGHGFGDSVIRMLGATIANSVRTADFACRYGGEEFVLLLPEIDEAGAHAVAERVMREFTHCSPAAPDGTRPFLSVSVGLAQLRTDDTPATLFERADAAMYRAKARGRCRIETEDPDAAPLAASPGKPDASVGIAA